MDFIFSMNIIFLILIVILILIVTYKVLIKKEKPNNYYTPFDYIAGQTEKEFYINEEEEAKNKNGS